MKQQVNGVTEFANPLDPRVSIKYSDIIDAMKATGIDMDVKNKDLVLNNAETCLRNIMKTVTDNMVKSIRSNAHIISSGIEATISYDPRYLFISWEIEKKIMALLDEYEIKDLVNIFWAGHLIYLLDGQPRFFEYVSPDEYIKDRHNPKNIFSMLFGGRMYELMNDHDPQSNEFQNRLNEIFEAYGLYYELEASNILSLYELRH